MGRQSPKFVKFSLAGIIQFIALCAFCLGCLQWNWDHARLIKSNERLRAKTEQQQIHNKILRLQVEAERSYLDRHFGDRWKDEFRGNDE